MDIRRKGKENLFQEQILSNLISRLSFERSMLSVAEDMMMKAGSMWRRNGALVCMLGGGGGGRGKPGGQA